MSSEMLREVSDSLFEFLIEAFPTAKSYSRADIEQDPMPPLLAHFLGQTLQHKLDVEVEHLRTVRSTWFDYDHPDVQHTYKAFIAALAQNSKIPSEEWRGTLKRATKLVIAHLILPTHTLVEYVFRDDEGPLPAPVIYRQLSYFAAYPYLREAVETFLKKRQLKEIDRTRFSSLLTQIDRHMTANYAADEWTRMLRPLFDLMRRVPQTRNQGVPIDLLSMFFGDKEAYEIQERLGVEKEVHRVSTISEDSLRRVIEGSVGPFEQKLTQEAPPPKPAPAATPPKAPAANDETVHLPFSHQPKKNLEPVAKKPEPELVKEESGESAEDSRPLWEKFQQKPEAPKAPPLPKNGDHPPETAKRDGSVPLWMQFQHVDSSPDTKGPVAPKNIASELASQAAPPPPSPPAFNQNATPTPVPPSPVSQSPTPPPNAKPRIEDLERDILGPLGSMNRSMFVENLFAGSNQEYEAFLTQIKQIPDWSMASKVILEDVFKKHKVNIYSPAAIMFTESIEEQFRQN